MVEVVSQGIQNNEACEYLIRKNLVPFRDEQIEAKMENRLTTPVTMCMYKSGSFDYRHYLVEYVRYAYVFIYTHSMCYWPYVLE